MLSLKNNISKNLKLWIFLIFCLTTSISAQCLSGNCKNGQGKFKTKSGHIYEGTFVNGKKEGQGTYLWPSGAKYVGAYKNDEANGFGVYTYADGDIYEGNYVNGKKEGKGTYKFKSGNVFTGEFKDGKKHGPGKLYIKQKSIYQEGNWKDDVYFPKDSAKTVNKTDKDASTPPDSSQNNKNNAVSEADILKLQISAVEVIEAKFDKYKKLLAEYKSNSIPKQKKENLELRASEMKEANRVATHIIANFGDQLPAESKTYFASKALESENNLKRIDALLYIDSIEEKDTGNPSGGSFLDQTLPVTKSDNSNGGQPETTTNGTGPTTAALSEKAKSAIEKGEYTKSFDDLNLIISREPENSEAYAQRAQVYFMKDLTDKGIADVGKALSINPKNVTALTLRGLYKGAKDEWIGADEDFILAFSLKPDDPLFLRSFIRAVEWHPEPMRLRSVQQKLALLKREAELNQNFETYNKLDNFFQKISPKQNSAEAKDPKKSAAFRIEADKPRLAYYESLVKLNDKNVCAYYFMARGNEFAQKASLEKAMYNYDGKNGARCSARAAFAFGLSLGGGYDRETLEAAKYYKLALDRDPTIPDVKDWLARIYKPKNSDSLPSSSQNDNSNTSQNTTVKDTFKVESAIREYNKVHSQIETSLQQYLNDWRKYTRADPVMRSMMSGTRRDLERARESALSAIVNFLKEYGDYLPSSMSSHLTADGSKFTSLPF